MTPYYEADARQVDVMLSFARARTVRAGRRFVTSLQRSLLQRRDT